jgi:predicted P-loop ATPase
MFASRKVDRARPAYGRHRIDRPRRCIFIGSTNDDEYLKDTTGNRRFWPFTPGDIDVEALRRDRDQLWAEAVSIEAGGEELFIPEELWPEAQERQQSRMSSHPWEDRLLNLTAIHGATVVRVTNESGEEEWRVGSDYIFTSLLSIPVDRLNEGHAKTLKGVMRKLGWTGPTKLRVGGTAVRGYRKLCKE